MMAATDDNSEMEEDSAPTGGTKKWHGNGATVTQCRRVTKGIPFLDELSDDDLQGLAPLTQWREYVAGSTIFFEDDAADAVYFIMEGAVEIFKSDDTGKKLPLVILRDAGVIGEMGLFSREERSATARTLTSVRLLCITNDALYGALDADELAAHHLVFSFARVLSQRLNEVNRKLFELYDSHSESPTLRELSHPHQSLLSEF